MQDPKDDPEFQEMLAELYGEMEESIPRQFGKTEMKHTLTPGAQALRLENVVRLYESLTGRKITPQEIEELRAHRKQQGIED